MKNRLYLCLSLAFFVCLGLYIKTDASFLYVPAELWQQDHSQMDSGGLNASAPRILSTPADGSVFHGVRTISPGYQQIYSQSWTPTKPGDFHHIKIGITATGYGEVAFTLNGETMDYAIGHWTSEPLKKANKQPYTFRITRQNNLYNPARLGYEDKISPLPKMINVSATGSAQTRSRLIVTYGSRQAALNVQASATGPSVGFVIGSSTFWKWDPGITRDVKADDYNGKYTVTVDDTIIDSGSGNGSGSDSQGSGPGCSNDPDHDWCTDDGACSTRSGSGVPGECGHDWCCCAPSNAPTYDPSANNNNNGNSNGGSSNSGNSGNSNNNNNGNNNNGNNNGGSSNNGNNTPSPTLTTCSGCGVSYDPNSSSANSHHWISSCNAIDANWMACTNTSGYYACSPHTHTYPGSENSDYHACGVHLSSASGDHIEYQCWNCGGEYWGCSDESSNHMAAGSCADCGDWFMACNGATKCSDCDY